MDVSYAKFDGELVESIHILVGSHCGGHNGKKLLKKTRFDGKNDSMVDSGCNMSFDVKFLAFSERAYFSDEMGWKIVSVLVVNVML